VGAEQHRRDVLRVPPHVQVGERADLVVVDDVAAEDERLVRGGAGEDRHGVVAVGTERQEGFALDEVARPREARLAEDVLPQHLVAALVLEQAGRAEQPDLRVEDRVRRCRQLGPRPVDVVRDRDGQGVDAAAAAVGDRQRDPERGRVATVPT
jgi:hypothetical protein